MNQDNGTYRRQLDQQAQLNIQKDLTISTQGDAQFNAVKINTDNATFYIGGNLTLGYKQQSIKNIILWMPTITGSWINIMRSRLA